MQWSAKFHLEPKLVTFVIVAVIFSTDYNFLPIIYNVKQIAFAPKKFFLPVDLGIV